jgi:hypothetical protein
MALQQAGSRFFSGFFHAHLGQATGPVFYEFLKDDDHVKSTPSHIVVEDAATTATREQNAASL